MLRHAAWAPALDGARLLDLFAGTGALGLEALSRGAAAAVFVERDPAALVALRRNIVACGAEALADVRAGDACRLPTGGRVDLVFLDPPYGSGLVASALAGLGEWADADTLIVAELGRGEAAVGFGSVLAERGHGAGRVVFGRVDFGGR